MNTLMTYSYLIFSLLSFLVVTPRAEAATCSFTAANWEINVKGNDVVVRSLIGAPTTDITQVPAANGWERNPSLGYPISDELTPTVGSSNRYTDFENGVIYWNSASGKAVELFPFPPASRDKADFELAAQTQINELLVPHGDQVYGDNCGCDKVHAKRI